MTIKKLMILMVIIVSVFHLASCANAPVTEKPGGTSIVIATAMPSATATLIPTKTPDPTETITPTPTPEVIKFNGIITELDKIPVLTADQEAQLIQQAIDSRTLISAPNELQIGQLIFNDITFGKAIRVQSNPTESFRVLATYITMIQTSQGGLPLVKVLYELHVRYEDGSEGSVIVPVVFNQDYTVDGDEPDRDTRYRLKVTHDWLIDHKIFFQFLVKLENKGRKPNSPVIIALLEQLSNDPEAQVLLQKAYNLAKFPLDGKFLSQDEINKLLNFIIFY